MKLICWNVNSVRTRLPRLLALLERHAPDVVCLQELKCVEGQFPFVDIQDAGYRSAMCGQKTYNGVAILTKDAVTDVRHGFADDDEEDPQARLISADVGGVRVVCAYVPNGKEVGDAKWEYKLAWYGRLRALLDRDFSTDQPLVVCGDFNIAPDDSDVAKPERWADSVLCHPDGRAALQAIVDWGLVDTIRQHHPEGGPLTWWDYRQLAFPKGDGLRIDHILATSALAERCTATSVDRDERKGKQPSDHAPVIAEFD